MTRGYGKFRTLGSNFPGGHSISQASTGGTTGLPQGQRFAHFNVLSLLGAGGMGEVYLAEDTRLKRRVALKILPREFTLDEERLRLAYSGLADCYNSFGFSFDVGSLPPSDAIPKAKAAAQKAIDIDDSLAEAHTSLAYTKQLYDWDWSGADKEFKRAFELNPNYVNAHHWYSHYLAALGRNQESVAESKRSLELAPLDLIINTHLGWNYIFVRQYDLAVEQLRKTLEMDPNYGLTHWYLGMAYELKGMYPDAAPEFLKAIEILKGNTVVETDMGHFYAVSGRKGEALKIIEKAREISGQKYVSSYQIALIYTGLGERDRAFEWFDKAYQEHSDLLVYLKVDPRLDSIRSDSRFADLVRRVGL